MLFTGAVFIRFHRALRTRLLHHVPLVGDLLGRERVTGAKKTRAGCDNKTDRFEHIVEAPAVWHAKQSFLCVSQKIIMTCKI